MNMSGEQVRAALNKDGFVPFFPAGSDAPWVEVAGMEVLARWLHPALGIVPPGAFIATA
jgi:EAL domain-containing protein (putative c-di-GMP-specific phosphodiesterase class I)